MLSMHLSRADLIIVIVKIETVQNSIDEVKAAYKVRCVQRMNYLRIPTLLDRKRALVKIKIEAFLSSSAHPCRPATHHLPGYTAGQYCLLAGYGWRRNLSAGYSPDACQLLPYSPRHIQVILAFCACISGAQQILTCDCRLEAVAVWQEFQAEFRPPSNHVIKHV